ncbi:hypothetical protein H072_625 [Dactylellina haptotyla CBS 200.50]|uniref:GH16 domain-containing protein n=1 Tax=Dactylellina haptotyla (strain CBS 200.50) TaxID=1284197 RepID=S8AWQ0_DACHA|nr:hypothetical protein H072_625 [Dactylellina haptotyla CBS 200.50]
MQPEIRLFLYFTLLIVTAQASLFKLTPKSRRSYQPLYKRVPTPANAGSVSSICSCGYYIPETKQTFTHYVTLKPDALSANNLPDSLSKQGWEISSYELTSKPKNITYTPSNLSFNPSSRALELIVSGGSTNRTSIPSAEISTKINSIRYGSFRFKVKASPVAGACSGMFFYKDDNHEIDIEILTSHIHNGGSQADGIPLPGLQLTVQRLTQSQTLSNYKVLPFDGSYDPTKGYHEYRFDWLQSGVRYFIDGNSTSPYTKFIPNVPGSILINNWSNGDRYWPAGPPTQNSILSIREVDLYFNVTDPSLLRAWEAGCKSAGYVRTCSVAPSKGG